MDAKMASDQRQAASGVVGRQHPAIAQRTTAHAWHSSLSPNPDSPSPRRAFTLTELLVVITIIAVLAALTTAGVMRAMGTARQTRIKVEVDQLDAALRSYKEKYGSYPPSEIYNFATNAALRAHVARAFPRYNLNDLPGDLQAAGLDNITPRPDHALVFWLRGFSSDVTHPFVTFNNEQIVGGMVPNPGTKVATNPFFEFDPTRLKQLNYGTATYRSYVPAGVKTNAPYLYFDQAYLSDNTVARYFDSGDIFDPDKGANLRNVAGFARPSFVDTDQDGAIEINGDDQYANADSFQIIATGMDGKYCDPALNSGMNYADWQVGYPDGFIWAYGNKAGVIDTNYDDNVSNFCDRARMGDARP